MSTGTVSGHHLGYRRDLIEGSSIGFFFVRHKRRNVFTSSFNRGTGWQAISIVCCTQDENARSLLFFSLNAGFDFVKESHEPSTLSTVTILV